MERPLRPRKRSSLTAGYDDEGDAGDDEDQESDASWEAESEGERVSSELGGSSWCMGDSSEASRAGSRSSDGPGADECHEVRCPDLEQTQFVSWEDFHAYLDIYQKQTFQIFRKRSSKSVADRNKAIKSAQRSSSALIPAEWETYATTLICTHGGTYKYRGQGKRPRQEARPINGNVQINACVREVTNSPPQFAVCVSKTFLKHNHPLGLRIYKQYAANRMAVDRSAMDMIDSIRKAGAKAKSILKFLVENTDSNPTPQDVQNLIRTLKKRERSSTSSAQRLKRWTRQFCAEHGNIGHIYVQRSSNGKKYATCITVQTKHMLDIYRRFPEVLMIDATHGTNISKYKIFSFMAHDVFGKGQYVQHAILENERSDTLFTAIEEFKKNNPAWTKLQCVIVEKDFTEIGVLKAALPHMRVLLCQFHVVKYLREKIACADYVFASWQKSQLRSVVNLLVYARSEREYEKHRRYLKHLTSIGLGGVVRESNVEAVAVVTSGAVGAVGHASDTDDTIHPFQAYFTKNWDNCRDMWCSYKRQNAVTLGNNTNNRLESSWKHMKEVVTSSMGLDECLATIIFYQNQAEQLLYDRASKVSLVHHEGYDREMGVVANLVSEHVCKLIHEQYAYATGSANYTFYEAFPGLYFDKNASVDENCLDEPCAKYTVSKSTWECSCLFMSTRLLPCRHVFYIRKSLGMETIIPTQLLNPRCLLATINESQSPVEISQNSFAVSTVLTGPRTPWDSNRKFREANHLATSICDSISSLGMSEFRVAMKALVKVTTLLTTKRFNQLSAIQIDDGNPSTLDGANHADNNDGKTTVSVELEDVGYRRSFSGAIGGDIGAIGGAIGVIGGSIGAIGGVGGAIGAVGAVSGAISNGWDSNADH